MCLCKLVLEEACKRLPGASFVGMEFGYAETMRPISTPSVNVVPFIDYLSNFVFVTTTF